MDFGVIGVRSKHLNFFRQALARLYPDGAFRITHVCGLDAPECVPQDPELAVCPDPRQLISVCDGVILALREGTQHSALAQLCLQAGKPVFIDKPFTCSPGDAAGILRCAQQTGTPCTGGSTICFTPAVQGLAARLPACKNYTLSYQADPFDPYGGWYFYGSHLTDLCAMLFGDRIRSVSAQLQRGAMTVLVTYPAFTVTLKTTPAVQPPVLFADRAYILDDQGCYDAGMAHFCQVAAKKAPGQAQRLQLSVQIMDAVFTSLRMGQPVPLP